MAVVDAAAARHIWFEHAMQFLSEGENIRVCQVLHMPDHLLRKARASYAELVRPIIQILAPLQNSSLFISGLHEACKATDIHLARCDDFDYEAQVPAVWGVDVSEAMDVDSWVFGSGLYSTEFPELLQELNNDEADDLAEVVEWLGSCTLTVIWLPDLDNSQVILVFKHGDVQGSIFWQEEFVDPVGFFL